MPNVVKEVDRIEFHDAENFDASNTMLVEVSVDDGTTWHQMVKRQETLEALIEESGELIARYAPIGVDLASVHPKWRFTWTQESSATTYAAITGHPTAWFRLRPVMVDGIGARIDVRKKGDDRTQKQISQDLKALVGRKIFIDDAPDRDAFWAVVSAVQEEETESNEPKRKARSTVALVTLRTVEVEVAV